MGVHVVSGDISRGYFHIWSEDEGGRGSDEIVSALLAFVNASKLSTSCDGHLIAWSDSCAGQNENFVVICLWQLLILQKKYAQIEHKFPEPGHSFLI